MREDHQYLVPRRRWESATSGTVPITDPPVVGTAVVAVDLRVEVEGEPAELGEGEPVELEDPTPFPSEGPGFAAGAGAASEPVVEVAAVTVGAIIELPSSQH